MIAAMDNHDDLPLFAPPPARAAGREKVVISVSDLNRRTRNLLEANLELLWVAGEMSNVVRAASGHWYFSLKDAGAQVRCVMFKNRASLLGFVPENGDQVEVRALPSLYEPRGEFQLGVETIRRAGLGALYEAYERLKKKLGDAGLFDAERKRSIPAFPRTIGIVTSPQAAALRDVLTTLARRAPMTSVVLYPTAVQGATAARDIVAAIDSARMRAEVETLIICRGGGSIEDLWSFNDEGVARAIARLQAETGIAVISGVGHETDFTICDFVADRRAPTPTAAAELSSPNRDDLITSLATLRARLRRTWQTRLETAQQRLDHAARGLLSPAERVARERDRLTLLATRARHVLLAQRDQAGHRLAMARQRLATCRPDIPTLDQLAAASRQRLHDAWDRSLDGRRERLARQGKALTHLSPQHVLERGYSIVESGQRILRDAKEAQPGDRVGIRLARGRLAATVLEVVPEKDDPA
jgi:exodeoxyribonuclease VII large subunit